MTARAKQPLSSISEEARRYDHRGLRTIREMMHRVRRKKSKKKKLAKPRPSSVSMMAGYSQSKARRRRSFFLGLISSGLFQEGILGWSAMSRRVLSKYLRRALRDSRVETIELMKTNARTNTKKLHLVLDLDNTLLHTVNTNEMLWQEDGTKESGDLYIMGERLTKLRPFVWEFLREANSMFMMTIYTTGSRYYGQKIANLLDPKGLYFGNRVITREDCTQQGRKSLDVVPASESDVIIIDDRAKVWPNHARNLIQIEPYYYFLTEKGKGKEDDQWVLRTILKRLRRIHDCYLWSELGFGGSKDVRVLLQHIMN